MVAHSCAPHAALWLWFKFQMNCALGWALWHTHRASHSLLGLEEIESGMAGLRVIVRRRVAIQLVRSRPQKATDKSEDESDAKSAANSKRYSFVGGWVRAHIFHVFSVLPASTPPLPKQRFSVWKFFFR